VKRPGAGRGDLERSSRKLDDLRLAEHRDVQLAGRDELHLN
jgi:hypothetical protein